MCDIIWSLLENITVSNCMKGRHKKQRYTTNYDGIKNVTVLCSTSNDDNVQPNNISFYLAILKNRQKRNNHRSATYLSHWIAVSIALCSAWHSYAESTWRWSVHPFLQGWQSWATDRRPEWPRREVCRHSPHLALFAMLAMRAKMHYNYA